MPIPNGLVAHRSGPPDGPGRQASHRNTGRGRLRGVSSTACLPTGKATEGEQCPKGSPAATGPSIRAANSAQTAGSHSGILAQSEAAEHQAGEAVEHPRLAELREAAVNTVSGS